MILGFVETCINLHNFYFSLSCFYSGKSPTISSSFSKELFWIIICENIFFGWSFFFKKKYSFSFYLFSSRSSSTWWFSKGLMNTCIGFLCGCFIWKFLFFVEGSTNIFLPIQIIISNHNFICLFSNFKCELFFETFSVSASVFFPIFFYSARSWWGFSVVSVSILCAQFHSFDSSFRVHSCVH